ncbi:hypothetical protein NQ318_007482, partial [Aromia moschata]
MSQYFREPRKHARQYNDPEEENILEAFDQDATRSIRNVAAMLGVRIWKVWSVLHANGRHAFHYTLAQGLEE